MTSLCPPKVTLSHESDPEGSAFNAHAHDKALSFKHKLGPRRGPPGGSLAAKKLGRG